MRVRLYGHVGMQTGYGRAARELGHSLVAAGVELEICPIGDAERGSAPGLEAYLRRPGELAANPDVAIVHQLPVDCPRSLEMAGLARSGAGTKLVAYTTWEAYSPPPDPVWEPLTMLFDAVWVPSTEPWRPVWQHPEGAVISVIPHAYDELRHAERVRSAWASGQDRPEAFRFYYIGAWTARKNPTGLIRAYLHAFTAQDDVELRLHCAGADQMAYIVAVAQAGVAQRDLPKIQFSNKPYTDDEVDALHGAHDCFVTATRGEAWNLPAFDAMLVGRHIITPSSMGSNDYLDDTSTRFVDNYVAPAFVDVRSIDAGKGQVGVQVVYQQGVDARALWLEPNLLDLADAMRQAYEERERTLAIDYNVAERYGRQAVGKLVLSTLEQLK